MYLIKYSPFYFHYCTISKERLCVGILFYNATTGERDFLHIRNFDRFSIFYGEVNIEEELEATKDDILNYEKCHHEPFDINDYARASIHLYTFSKIREFEVDENFDYKTYLSKLYMRYDYPKEERL